MTLHSVERFSQRAIREGELLHANAVSAANIVRDVREMITNTFGGKMKRYERLTEDTVQRALEALEAKAKQAGYDGVVGVRIVHPQVVEGGVEVVVFGTGFNYDDAPPTA